MVGNQTAQVDVADIIGRLDIRAEYAALGVQFGGKAANTDGWLPVHAIGRDDRNASAAINLQTGRYKDHGGDGCNLSLFDFAAVKAGKFSDWMQARDYYAERADVATGNGSHKPSGNGHISGKPASQAKPATKPIEGQKHNKIFDTSAEALAVYERQLGQRSTWYEYLDASGQCNGIINRWDNPNGKQIRPVSRIGNGWACCGMQEPRPLYRLPSLATAETVYVSEGEKATDATVDLGLIGTTSPHGAKSADKADWGPLAGKQVIILPDHDEDGESYAAAVAGLLTKLDPAPVVKILRLPDLPPKGDAFDYVSRRRSEGATGDAIKDEFLRMAQEAGVRNVTATGTQGERPAENGDTTAKAGDKQETAFRIKVLTSAELDDAVFTTEYFIPYLLAKHEPAIVAAPQKSLKTSLMGADLLLSIANGDSFAGYFDPGEPHRVLFMSGESGFATLQETARRICASKGRLLRDCENMLWSEQLPQFGNVAHIEETRRVIRDHGVQLLAIDPCYLAMPGADAGNLFIQGGMMRDMASMIRDEGASLILIHHTKTIPVQRLHAPLELSDIAWAGFQEFARQWFLLNRRKPYDPNSNGEHALWLNVGSSAGHGGLWGVDITEGKRTATTTRFWDISVRPGSEAQQSLAEQEQTKRANKREANQIAAVQVVYAKILDAFVHFSDGATKRRVRERIGQPKVFDEAWAKACNSGELVECRVRADNGQTYDGFRRRYDPNK